MSLFQLKNRIPPIFTNSFIAALDQALLSVVNFIVAIILIKNVSKVDYGFYTIAFSVSFFLIGIQNTIVTTPLTILLVTKKGINKLKYISDLGIGQYIVIVPVVFVGLVLSFIMYYLGFDEAKISIARALTVATIGIFFREFLRSYFFAEESPFEVLKLDVWYVLAYLSFIGIAYLYFKIKVDWIFIFIGSSALFVSLYFAKNIKWTFDIKSIQKSYSENWKFGRWALLGGVATHLQSYGHLYFLGALIGSDAVADVSAARLLLAPFIMIHAGWGKIIRPHGSNLREQKQLKRFFSELVAASVIISVLILLYTILLISLSGFLGDLFFTEKYERSLDLIVYWGAIFAIGFIKINSSFGLQVIKKFAILAKFNTISMIISICLSYILIISYGIKGGLISLFISELISAAVLWWILGAAIFSGDHSLKSSFKGISGINKKIF